MGSVCVCVCVLCSLCMATALSESAFGKWHLYTLRMVTAELAGAARARGLVLSAPELAGATHRTP